MTGTERDAFESTLQVIGEGDKKRADMRNIRARVCALCIVGENGERLFTDAEVDSLGKKSAAALDRVFNVAQEMNGMGEKAVEAAKKP
jgi:hypothetical protein